jgi:hypothetical protein
VVSLESFRNDFKLQMVDTWFHETRNSTVHTSHFIGVGLGNPNFIIKYC